MLTAKFMRFLVGVGKITVIAMLIANWVSNTIFRNISSIVHVFLEQKISTYSVKYSAISSLFNYFLKITYYKSLMIKINKKLNFQIIVKYI